jgi:signal transduction histidine kinase
MRFFPSRHLILGVLVLLTLGINALFAYFNIQRLVSNGRNVSLTFTVNDDIDALFELVDDVDANQRSFIATGQKSALAEHQSAIDSLRPALNRVAVESADTQQRETLNKLRVAVREYQKVSQRGIRLRQKSGARAAQSFISAPANRETRAQVESLLDQMRIREQEILEERAFDSREAASDATRTFWIATVVEIAFLILILILLWRAARQNFALETAYGDLKRAEELRDNLSAMLVHDLRTPLTSLLGPLQLLESGALGPLDETQRELVMMSELSGQRLLTLVNELLDISKMEADEFQIHPEAIEVGELVLQALSSVRVFSGGHGARIEMSVTDDTQKIEVDADLIVRVLVNLLGNALKFTPAEGTITVGTTLSTAPGTTMMKFWVLDSGKGIPPEYVDKIFEKFGQVESRAEGQRFSTGLGLTFCKLAVEAHGGRIGVESEVGNGSLFWFTVPLVAIANEVAMKTSKPVAASAKTATRVL